MIRDFILEVFKFIGELNYWHVALLSALESTCLPVVIPVETVIIPMGYYAYLGTKSLPLLIFSTTFGIITGCLVNYYFARFLGRSFIYKHSKLLHINIEKLQKLEQKFLKHGRLLMFVGRFVPIPAFKHIITIPAGMCKMPVPQFLFYNGLGGLIFSTAMLLIGYFFGSSEELWKKALGNFMIICLVVLFTYFIIRLVINFVIKRRCEYVDIKEINNIDENLIVRRKNLKLKSNYREMYNKKKKNIIIRNRKFNFVRERVNKRINKDKVKKYIKNNILGIQDKQKILIYKKNIDGNRNHRNKNRFRIIFTRKKRS